MLRVEPGVQHVPRSPGLAAGSVLGAGGTWHRPSPARPSLIRALCLAGAAEGDAEGAHAAGRGAALCHLLPGHAAADADPAGPHPAQPAHRLLQVAHPHGPPGKGPGQVRPQTAGTISLGVLGLLGEVLCAGMGVPAAQFPLWPWHSADRSDQAGVLSPVPCCLSPRRLPLLCAVIQAGWQHLAVSLLCPQALCLVCPELLLLPQQEPGLCQAEEEASGGH